MLPYINPRVTTKDLHNRDFGEGCENVMWIHLHIYDPAQGGVLDID